MAIAFLIVGIAAVATSIAVARDKELNDAIWESARRRGLVATGLSESQFRAIVRAGSYIMAAFGAIIVISTIIGMI